MAIFTIRELISTLPSVVFYSAIPFFILSMSGDLALVGAIFLAMRLLSVVGAQLQVHMSSRVSHRNMGVYAETFNVVVSAVAFVLLHQKMLGLFCVAVSLRGLTVGLISNLNFDWLKNIDHEGSLARTFVQIKAIGQASYGVAGIVLYLLNKDYIALLIIVDLVSSLVGMLIFWNLKKLTIPAKIEPYRTSPLYSLRDIFFHKETRNLMLLDLAVAASLSGCNIFLFKYGNHLLAGYGGYYTALVLYSLSFLFFGFLGKALFSNKSQFVNQMQFSITAVAVCFSMLSGFFLGVGFHGISQLAFVGILLCYPVVSLSFEKLWFDTLPAHKAGPIFAARLLLVQCTWALGEWVFAVISNDASIRAVCVVVALVMLFTFRMSGSFRTNSYRYRNLLEGKA